MINTAIGIGKPATLEQAAFMQEWCERNDLGVYVPQRIDGESANISVEYDPSGLGLKWKDATVKHLASLRYSMLMHFGSYFHTAATWKTVAFPDPVNPGVKLTQDELTLETLTVYMKNIVGYLWRKNINAYMFVDEPPHKFSDPANPGKYHWTPENEKRNIKWIHSCVAASLPVLIAVPGPSQLRFWRERLPDHGITWALDEKHDPAAYAPLLPVGEPIWVYNVRAINLRRMAVRLNEYTLAGLPVVGVLMWSATPTNYDNEMPFLFNLSGETPVPTPEMMTFISQLKAYSYQPPVELTYEQKVDILWAERGK